MCKNNFIFCSYCNKIITNRHSTFTVNGNLYYFCTSICYRNWLKKESCQCFSCGANIVGGNNRFQYADGRVSCQQCFHDSIRDTSHLESCERKVLRFFREKYQYSPPCCVKPELCDKFVFKTKFKMISDDILGVYGLSTKKNSSLCEIKILTGLRQDVCEAVIAHEFAHDMMFHRWSHIDNLIIQEGFARYIETKYNLYANKDYNNKLLMEKPADYGPNGDPYYDGLLLFLSIERARNGYNGIVDYITQYQQEHLRLER